MAARGVILTPKVAVRPVAPRRAGFTRSDARESVHLPVRTDGDVPPDLNDRQWVERIRAGDIGAFETVFRTLAPPLCVFTRRFVGSAGAAEDIVQDLFLALWRQHETLDVHGSLVNYLYTAARNRDDPVTASRPVGEPSRPGRAAEPRPRTPGGARAITASGRLSGSGYLRVSYARPAHAGQIVIARRVAPRAASRGSIARADGKFHGRSRMTPRIDRGQMRVRVLRQRDDVEGSDAADLTPSERVAMMWQLARDAWTFLGEPGRAESRLQRHVVRIQRRAR